jgi:anti-sigma factor RsiW
MNCTQTRERLLALEYGELSPTEQAEVDSHLATCATCQRESAAWREFRGKLGAFTGPVVHVNLATVYQHAMRRHERRVQSWRRTAIAASAAAAAVVVIVLVLKLEVRVNASQVVVRWGPPEQVLSATTERPAPAIQTRPGAPQVSAEDLALVKDLVRVLAQDAQNRDRQQQKALLQMEARFETLLRQVDEYVFANERDKAGLYTAQFRLRKKGDTR